MKRDLELLAPGGDVDSIKAAITAGANAIYCGLNRFNARNRATNITISDLNGILNLAHKNSCKVFLTLNIIVVGSEIPSLIKTLNTLVNTSIDGVIVQDMGIFYILSRYFKSLKVHASTQCTTHNEGQIKFLKRLQVTRLNLSRELNINEIGSLTSISHKNDIETEVFVHGSYCIGFSGLCYLSSVHSGNSGNRGRCSQPCRDRYHVTPQGQNYPLNLKDNSVYSELKELYDTGVDSIKIEGRIKKFDYVYTVVNSWKKQIRRLDNGEELLKFDEALYHVFNRGFSNSFLKGEIDKGMFVDDPRDSLNALSKASQKEIYEEKDHIWESVKKRIGFLSIAKEPLLIDISGKEGGRLTVNLKTLDSSFKVLSDSKLVKKDDIKSPKSLNELFEERLRSFNDTNYYTEHIDFEGFETGLFLPFKEITKIKKRIIFLLNGSKEFVAHVELPLLKKQSRSDQKATLSVLISSEKDLEITKKSSTDIFFKIPDCLKKDYIKLKDLFISNLDLIPLFPSVLIGDDYSLAVKFLKEVKPKLIVTNNTGIAYEAFEHGIDWIAGPYLNLVNSFSLLCLKEEFNCCGAFISNELSKVQLKSIIRPDDFKLYYSICHPVLLLTSRQCLFHQVTGCEKMQIDGDCIENCTKNATIINLKGVPLFIEKSKGNYHKIYNDHNYLNTDVVNDFKNLFSNFSIDLRDIKTKTEINLNKSALVGLFEKYLDGSSVGDELKRVIRPSTDKQYIKGI
jgi:putative protease